MKLVQRVMYGARPTTDFASPRTPRRMRAWRNCCATPAPAFEFLCASWPEVVHGQASEALARWLPRLRARGTGAAKRPRARRLNRRTGSATMR